MGGKDKFAYIKHGVPFELCIFLCSLEAGKEYHCRLRAALGWEVRLQFHCIVKGVEIVCVLCLWHDNSSRDHGNGQLVICCSGCVCVGVCVRGAWLSG